MYKYWAIFPLLVVLVLASCAQRPRGVKGWEQPSQAIGHSVRDALFERSKKINALKGKVWAKVTIDGIERPSVRSSIYWLKAGDGSAHFRVFGYGPFSVIVFDASFSGAYFQLIVPREGAIFWKRPSTLERYLAHLIFDPWGIAAIEGAECERGKNGQMVVRASIQGSDIKGVFDPSLNPVSIGADGIKIAFALPEKIVVTLRSHESNIKIELRLSHVSEASKKEVRQEIERRPDVSGFRVYPLKMLLDSYKR